MKHTKNILDGILFHRIFHSETAAEPYKRPWGTSCNVLLCVTLKVDSAMLSWNYSTEMRQTISFIEINRYNQNSNCPTLQLQAQPNWFPPVWVVLTRRKSDESSFNEVTCDFWSGEPKCHEKRMTPFVLLQGSHMYFKVFHIANWPLLLLCQSAKLRYP